MVVDENGLRNKEHEEKIDYKKANAKRDPRRLRSLIEMYIVNSGPGLLDLDATTSMAPSSSLFFIFDVHYDGTFNFMPLRFKHGLVYQWSVRKDNHLDLAAVEEEAAMASKASDDDICVTSVLDKGKGLADNGKGLVYKGKRIMVNKGKAGRKTARRRNIGLRVVLEEMYNGNTNSKSGYSDKSIDYLSEEQLIARCRIRLEKLEDSEKGKQRKHCKYPSGGRNEGSSCPLRCYGKLMLIESSFQVISLNEEHTCVRNFKYGNLVNYMWIVTPAQCRNSKTFSLNHDERTIEEHYAIIRSYGKEILDSNDGSIIKLELLGEDIDMPTGNGLTLIEDQHKGLIEAVKDVMPLAEHRQCVRHIYEGFEVSKVKIDVISKHPPSTNTKALRHLLKKQEPKPHLIRWILLIQEFDIEIKDRKGTENVTADHLSRIKKEEASNDSEVDDNLPRETLIEINTKDYPWFADFANYLVSDIIHKGMTYQQKNKFFFGTKHCFWEEPYLFKVCSNCMIRRCVSGPETQTILDQCYHKPTGGHYGPNTTAKKVLDSGFYWPTNAVVVRDFYKKFYNSLGRVPNRCGSSIGKTRGLLSFSRRIG
uniref:Reverse transcriptase domain-containing protein n=1 Tax=Tanacetum cinerariifolium TaxID=118510 RepID=A0A6L2K7W1_TANCI|nr:reverse transcriptase domain-containing protein [Tanacetum cinerariifolium]